MIIVNPNFELLPPNDILFRSIRVVSPFFTDQTVVSVVGIVCVTKTTKGELRFEKSVAMLA